MHSSLHLMAIYTVHLAVENNVTKEQKKKQEKTHTHTHCHFSLCSTRYE